MRTLITICGLWLVLFVPDARADSTVHEGMVWVPSGSYEPLFRDQAADTGGGVRSGPDRVRVKGFWIDPYPVTNGDYLDFVLSHPEWRRSKAKRLFADARYLDHWQSDINFGGEANSQRPVINVSWFSAKAYCKARGSSLATVDQWEYVAAASADVRDAGRNPEFQSFLRTWYARPTPAVLPNIGSLKNYYGVYDLHGVIWEWTLDFNSALVTGESRGDSAIERSLYCGGGAAGASDFENYAAFMRYAFRSSLEARYSVPNLGFRCACSGDGGSSWK